MCLYWTVKYFCGCIYDEWYSPCDGEGHGPNARKQDNWCYNRNIQETTDVLTLCEPCYAELDARVRKDGLKKVLQSSKSFPLAEQLGMLIVLENDESEQWKVFRKKRQIILQEGEWQIPETDGPADVKMLKMR
ncbi:hypothetical protein BJX76DRAFT_356082 [Aspergillus varians]